MNSEIVILFLAANPSQFQQLQLGEEVRYIREELRKSDLRDRFRLEQEWEVSFTDVQSHLLLHRPDVVHFSGHGSRAGGVVLHHNSSLRSPPAGTNTVRGRALARLFGLLEKKVQLVVLNACYSEVQARAIAEHVDCVVGMREKIGDRGGREFSAGLYRALGYGMNVSTAFELGCNQISLGDQLDEEIPQLLAPRCNPSSFYLLPDERELVLGRLEEGVSRLEARDYVGAARTFRGVLQQDQPPAEAYGYLALALQARRHFNALAPGDREEIEGLLIRASSEHPRWSLPWVLLGAMELDYYAYHGLTNPRDVSLPRIQTLLTQGSLSERDYRLLDSTDLGEEARCRLLAAARNSKELQ